jgi:hypothetical protein
MIACEALITAGRGEDDRHAIVRRDAIEKLLGHLARGDERRGHGREHRVVDEQHEQPALRIVHALVALHVRRGAAAPDRGLGRIDRDVHRRERDDGLQRVVLGDREVRRFEVADRMPVLIEDGDVEMDEIGPRLEDRGLAGLRLLGRAPHRERREQGHSDEHVSAHEHLSW